MAASFDKNGDVELNSELGQRRNQKDAGLWKKNDKLTNLTLILLVVILALAGIIVFLAIKISNLKNEGLNHTKGATVCPPEVTTSGPKDTKTDNVEIQSSCGGIINVEMNRTTHVKYQLVRDGFRRTPCTWIIKSDAKKVNLQWSNTRYLIIPDEELIFGELSVADEELHCRSIKAQGSQITNVVSTPAILHFKSKSYLDPLKFEMKLIPVTSGDTHKSQPQTYYVNKKPTGSLGPPNVRPDSLLGMVTVFENNNNRELKCSDLKEVHCCDSVQAYKIYSANGSPSCTKVSLSTLTTEMSSYGTVVVLAPTQGLCQLSWKKAEIGLNFLNFPFANVTVKMTSFPISRAV